MRDELMNVIDHNITRFLEHLAQSYPQAISLPQLQQSWQNFKTSTTTPPPPPLPPSYPKNSVPPPVITKKSGYQNFFTIRRLELKTKDPTLSFGDLSKKISAEWNILSASEKSRFMTPVTTTLTTPCVPDDMTAPPPHEPVPASPPANASFTLANLNNKKMDELKDLCEKRNLKKSGNKTELIRRLLGQKTEVTGMDSTVLVPRSITPLIMETPPSSEKRDSSLDIYVSSNSEKRSDFEHSAITPEEEDFEFENLSDKFNSDSESTIHDDEDDDDDAFGITE